MNQKKRRGSKENESSRIMLYTHVVYVKEKKIQNARSDPQLLVSLFP